MSDYYEIVDRLDRCEEEASSLFRIVTAAALARYHAEIVLIPDPKHTPRFDRARARARLRYELISVPAWELRNRAVHDLMLTGEVSAEVDAAMTELRDLQIDMESAASLSLEDQDEVLAIELAVAEAMAECDLADVV